MKFVKFIEWPLQIFFNLCFFLYANYMFFLVNYDFIFLLGIMKGFKTLKEIIIIKIVKAVFFLILKTFKIYEIYKKINIKNL